MRDERVLQHNRIAGLLKELEQEFGRIDQRVIEEVRQAWPLPDDKLPSAATPEL